MDTMGSESAVYETISSVPFEPAVALAAEWYAVCTRPRHEKQVGKQFQERGVEYFLPLYRSLCRWKDRRKELNLVLFPGYIFVRIALINRLQVLQLPGVVRFVSFSGLPASVPAEDVEALRNGFAHNLRLEYHPLLTVGRRVRVVSGPLRGARGILVRRKKNDCRLVISLEAIMRSVSLEIDESDVVPAS
jgi:transcription antitermination factor NusG